MIVKAFRLDLGTVIVIYDDVVNHLKKTIRAKGGEKGRED